MPSLTQLCKLYFACTDLYQVLRIPKSADEKEVRKAYHRLSLLVHPDRVEENKKEEATEKFKVLGKVHSILSDKEKKAIYDETGEYDEEDEMAERDWKDYWRTLFKKITIEDIKKYEEQYKGSEEELNDLKDAYINGEGSFDWILETVPFTHMDEEERLRKILQPLIDSGELPVFKSFTNEGSRKRAQRKRKEVLLERERPDKDYGTTTYNMKWQKEAEEAEQLREDLGIDSKNDLTALITSRREMRMAETTDFLDTLAAKYGPQKKEAANGKGKTTKGAKATNSTKGRQRSAK